VGEEILLDACLSLLKYRRRVSRTFC